MAHHQHILRTHVWCTTGPISGARSLKQGQTVGRHHLSEIAVGRLHLGRPRTGARSVASDKIVYVLRSLFCFSVFVTSSMSKVGFPNSGDISVMTFAKRSVNLLGTRLKASSRMSVLNDHFNRRPRYCTMAENTPTVGIISK